MHPHSKNSGFHSVAMPHGNFLVIPLYQEISGSPVPGVLVFDNRKSLFPIFVFSPCGFSNPASNRKIMIDALAMKKTKPPISFLPHSVLLGWCDDNIVISYLEVIWLMCIALALLSFVMELKGLKSWLCWSVRRRDSGHGPENIIILLKHNVT